MAATAIYTGLDSLQRAQRRAIGRGTWRAQRSVSTLALLYRQVAATFDLPPNSEKTTFLSPHSPFYVTAIRAFGSQPSGFEFQLSTDREGRFFTAPVASSLFAPRLVDGVRLAGLSLTEPRFCSGPVFVRMRNTAAVQQTCALLLAVAEPFEPGSLPAELEDEALLLSKAAPPALESGTAARVASLDHSGGGGGAPGAGPSNIVRQAIDIEWLGLAVTAAGGGFNQVSAELLGAAETTREIWQLGLTLDGAYTANVTAQLLAVSGSNSRPLGGKLRNIAPGGGIYADRTVDFHYLLEPGESLVLSLTYPDTELAPNWGGGMQYQTR